jgi:anti-anti-sigma factor
VTRYTGAWVGGFEVVSTSGTGCHVRRMSDGAVLPAVFGYDDVRPAPARRDVDRASVQVTLIQDVQSESNLVLRLPADLDIATVEAIRDSVLAAVDDAAGEVVLDLDDVRFLDSYGIRLLVTVRRRAWERDLPVRLHGGKPLIRDLLDLVGQDPLYEPALPATRRAARIE